MFYDESGSRLFEQITALPEYYPTRTERSLLETHADAIVASACADSQPLRLLELGAGTASKTCLLLAAAARRQIDVLYMPLDVSTDALEIACQGIESEFPRVLIEPVVVNYVNSPPQLEEFEGPTLALYLGSSIGNFTPEESRTILRNVGSQLQCGDALVLGTDLLKDESMLVAAYDDPDGVTAAFNLNVLHRLNKELGANFDSAGFRHCVRWNRIESRIEMHIESLCDQRVQIHRLASIFTSVTAKLSIPRTVTNSPIRLWARFFRTLVSRSNVLGKTSAIGMRSRLAAGMREDPAVRMRSNTPGLWLRDLLRKNLDVVFCGINPAQSAAQAGHHFSSPSNRFWRVLYQAGFTPHLIRPENDRTILRYGCGLTAAVERPTVSAGELTRHEFRQAAKELERKLQRNRPRFVAFLGKPAFAAIFRAPRVGWGAQSMRFGGAEVWILPNPSGLNRAFSLGELVSAYRELRTASR